MTSFLDLATVTGSTADDIVATIKDTLNKNRINLNNLVGIGTDNASVMIGVNNGVKKKLKNEVPNMVLIKCVCHSLQFLVSFAVKECLPRNLEFLIQETYNWFSKSPSGLAAYHQIL